MAANNQTSYDLLIAGGGQAGLAAAYHAQRQGLDYLVLEAHETIGQSWQDRYDSLTLFTPRGYSGLPGMPLPGGPEGYPTKGEVGDYLERYSRNFNLRVALGESVLSLTKEENTFRITTPKADYESKSVIVATGPFQTPRVPAWSDQLSIQHLHSSSYRNPAQIAGDKVLVVGGGNSGVQIAEELAGEHQVTMAVSGNIRFMPAKIVGKSLFWWLDKTGLLNAPADSIGARLLRKRGDPIIGTSFKKYIAAQQVVLRPEAINGQDAIVNFADHTSDTFDAAIWCTGYTQQYPWLHIPGALDGKGQPQQQEGSAKQVEGLYFLGLGWMRSRNSGLLGGVGQDAEYIIDRIRSER